MDVYPFSGPKPPAPITLAEIPLGYTAREALEMSLGKGAGTAIYKQIVNRVGLEPGQELGHGMKGVVYALPDGRVLKLTADASEIKAMTLLKGLKHPNLVRIDDVFVVCRGQSGVGVVVREWVGVSLQDVKGIAGLNEEMERILSVADKSIDDEIESRGEEEPTLDRKNAMSVFLDLLQDYSETLDDWPDHQGIVRGIRNGVGKLYDLGIYGIDFDARNIAVDQDGNPVIFDVGVVKMDTEPDVATIGCPKGRPIVSEVF